MTQYTTEQVRAKLAEAMGGEDHPDYGIIVPGIPENFDPLHDPADFDNVKAWAWAWGWGINILHSFTVKNHLQDSIQASVVERPGEQEIAYEELDHGGFRADMLRAEKEAVCRAVLAAWEAREGVTP